MLATASTSLTASGGRDRRRGFALFAVILVVAIVAVFGSVVVLSTAGTNSRNRAQLAFDELKLYNTRGQEFRLLYGGGTNNNFTKNPGRLSALTAPIVRPASCTGVYCELNTCTTQTFLEADVATWSTGSTARFGPFLTHRLIEKNLGYALPGGFGFVSDTLYRATAPPTQLTTQAAGQGQPVWVNIRGVELADAQELDRIANLVGSQGDGSAAGSVRWGAATSGQVTVFYMVAQAGTAVPGWAGC